MPALKNPKQLFEEVVSGLLKAYEPVPIDATQAVNVTVMEIRDKIVRVTVIPPEMFYEPSPWQR